MSTLNVRVGPCPRADILMGPPGLLFGATVAVFLLVRLIFLFI